MYERRESASFITGTVTNAILCLVSESSQHVEDGYAFLFDCPVYNFGGARHASLFLSKPLLCQTLLLGVNQMHVVVSLGIVFPLETVS